MKRLSKPGRWALVCTLSLLPSLHASAPKKPFATNDAVTVPLSLNGGAYGLGQIWFDREPLPDPESTEPKPPQNDWAGKSVENVKEPEKAGSFDLSWNLTSAVIYETHPAKYASSQPDWHSDYELSLEVPWTINDHITLTPSTGMRWTRYVTQKDRSSDEPFASLQATWRFADRWMASCRHESFWDYAPLDLGTGYANKQFAAHTTVARLQYDTSQPPRISPLRWQSYIEAAQSFAEPQTHNYFGFDVGTGCALRLVPQRLRLEIGAGISYQKYPNYHVETGEIRQGWNGHATSALVWTPCDHVRFSVGVQWMRSRENGREFHFDNMMVPLSVTISF